MDTNIMNPDQTAPSSLAGVHIVYSIDHQHRNAKERAEGSWHEYRDHTCFFMQ